jgi:hypothetical protein
VKFLQSLLFARRYKLGVSSKLASWTRLEVQHDVGRFGRSSGQVACIPSTCEALFHGTETTYISVILDSTGFVIL